VAATHQAAVGQAPRLKIMAKLYQLFIGCPFRKNVRTNYERLKAEIEELSSRVVD
jgi:hypothetical protein